MDRRHRILVVEDDDGSRKALSTWLSQDYEVVVARDGLEGLELATSLQPPPDVVVTDVRMPRLDGIAMVERLRSVEALRFVPVIFLTDQTSPRSMIAGIAAGARAYLPKPID